MYKRPHPVQQITIPTIDPQLKPPPSKFLTTSDAEPNAVGTALTRVTTIARKVITLRPLRTELAHKAAASHNVARVEADTAAVGPAARRVALVARVVIALFARALALYVGDAPAEGIGCCRGGGGDCSACKGGEEGGDEHGGCCVFGRLPRFYAYG